MVYNKKSFMIGDQLSDELAANKSKLFFNTQVMTFMIK